MTKKEGGLRLLVLDYNGTMMDDLAVAYGAVRTCYGVLGLPSPTLDEYRNGITADYMRFYWEHGIPRDVSGDQLNVIRKLYYRGHAHEAKFHKDLEPLLCSALGRGLKLAVCSAEIPDILSKTLNEAGLAKYFAVIKGGAWPNKRWHLPVILEALGLSADQAALVSDTAEDLQDAREVGMRTIGFLHPNAYNSPDRLQAFQPNHIVYSFRDLEFLLQHIAG